MLRESLTLEKKSLRLLSEKHGWDKLASVCVAFANAGGGVVMLGIEDGESAPPPEQKVDERLAEEVREKIRDKTLRVKFQAEARNGDNGGQFIEIGVERCSAGVASTSDGRYFQRVDDKNKPITAENLAGFLSGRNSEGPPWESLPVPDAALDSKKLAGLADALRAAGKIHLSVRDKSDDELASHYGLTRGGSVSNLGALFAGDEFARARTRSFAVLCLRFDSRGVQVGKSLWEYGGFGERAVWELPAAVWREIPAFRETYEIPDGMRRREFSAFPEAVVRELLVNALVHRSYGLENDILVKIHPDKMEVSSPGRLPSGITPRNVLDESGRRNPRMARLFHDLGLMESVGSGLDMICDILLSQGRPAPRLLEEDNRVRVIVERRPPDVETIALVEKTDRALQLNARERILLGMLAREREEIKISDIAARLGIRNDIEGHASRLLAEGILQIAGRGGTARLFIAPQSRQFSPAPVSRRPLSALILEDIVRHPNSRRGEIRARIGKPFSRHQVGRALADLKEAGKIQMTGSRATARYHVRPNKAR